MISARRFAAIGPRTLDDRVLQALQEERGEGPWSAAGLLLLVRQGSEETVSDVEAAIGRLMAAGRVKVAT